MSPSYMSSFLNLNPASRMFCPITLLLPPTFPYQAPHLGPSSLPQGILLVTISVVFPVPRTRLTHICPMDKVVELLKHWNKPWFAYRFLESQLFYVLYSDDSFVFYTYKEKCPLFCFCCPNSDFSYIWTTTDLWNVLPAFGLHPFQVILWTLAGSVFYFLFKNPAISLTFKFPQICPCSHLPYRVCSFLLPSLCSCGCLYLTKYSSTFKTNSNTLSSKELSMISLNWN